MRIVAALILLVGVCNAQTRVDYPSQIRNGPLFSDAGPVGATLQTLCASTGTGTLAITKTWTALATQAIPCSVQFTGGMFQPASGQTVTISGFDCPQTAQCFDSSLGGTFILPARSTITPNNFGARANGAGATGTEYSTQGQYALNVLRNSGGGSLFFPRAEKCYWLQNLTLYSSITLYSDSQATCIQKPAGVNPTIGQIFTQGDGSTATPISNVHFYNLTVDGNQDNQTGLAPDANGFFAFSLTGCSGCTIDSVYEKNSYGDGLNIDGYGAVVHTGTVNTSVPTSTVTAAVWDGANGGEITYTTSGAHGLTTAAFIAISGASPSGYNVGPCSVHVIDSTHFVCYSIADPGAYVSGGTVSSYLATSTGGTDFSGMAPGLQISIANTNYIVAVVADSTHLYLQTTAGAQSGVALSVTGYAGYGDNIRISNSTFTQNRRNDISVEASTNVVLENVHLSYAGLSGCTGTAPMAGFDIEPDEYGGSTAGFRAINVETDHNCSDGAELNTKIFPDPTFNPIIDLIAHDNGGDGFNGLSQSTIGTLQLTGVYTSNAGNAGAQLRGFNNPVLAIRSTGSARGVLFGNNVLNGIIAAGSVLSGTSTADLSVDGPNSNAIMAGGALINLGIQSGEAANVTWMATINPASAAVNGMLFWPGASPRNGNSAISSYCTLNNLPMLGSIVCSDLAIYSAGSFVVGGVYTILVVGSTDFTAIGASANTVGITFTATGIGSGSGTATIANAMQIISDTNTGTGGVGTVGATPACLFAFSSDTKGLCVNPAAPAQTYQNTTTFALGTVSPHDGSEVNIIDGSTNAWGATVSGGGSNHVKIRYNGTNWTVEGK